ncbi:hypothetical protein BC829DRAFT_263358 [Chytridium lagenaria]|nr:hypothetical protein BC829DRAFT_263358 [Chytridium lagenaria]
MTDTRTPAGRRYMTVKAQNRLIDSQTRSPPLPHVIVPEIGEVLIEPPSSPPPPPQNASSDLLHQIQDFIPLTFPNRKDALSIISTILTAVSHHRSTSKQDVTWSSHLPKLTQDDPTAPSPITMSDLAEHQQTTRHLPQFEIPATKAPQLPSNLFDLDMDDRQQVIEDYLYECEEKARFLGFRRDHHEPATFWNQPTAVDWVTLELSGEMRVRWRGVPADQRRTMSWEGFKNGCKSRLITLGLFQNVWKPLPVEEKKEPEPFISPHATEIPTPTIPSGWHLIAEPLTPALAQPLPITSTQENERDEEKREQDEQEEEEDIFSDSSSTISSHSSHSASIFDELSLPTRLDYPRGHRTPRLTPSERAEYIRNGWCVYCRSKDHVIDACTVGGRRHGRGPLSADERKRYYREGFGVRFVGKRRML